MIMYAQCPNCGGQLVEHKYTVPTISIHTLDRCLSCGWYLVETTSIMTELTDEKKLYEAVADITGEVKKE